MILLLFTVTDINVIAWSDVTGTVMGRIATTTTTTTSTAAAAATAVAAAVAVTAAAAAAAAAARAAGAGTVFSCAGCRIEAFLAFIEP
jgi:F420-0:gamma-glutamyl ligase-like protein